MDTRVKQVASSHKLHMPGILARTGYFLLHLLEMCIVMCAGGIATLSALLRWVGPAAGAPGIKTQFPELSTALLAIWLALVMALWMRFRRHEWRMTLEMASTSLLALPIVLGAAWMGAVPATSIYGLECGLACALMIVPMLLRLDHYAGAHGYHQKQAQPVHAEHQHAHHAQ